MTNRSIASLLLGVVLALAACGKDKKAEPAKADPAKPAAVATPPAADLAKPAAATAKQAADPAKPAVAKPAGDKADEKGGW